MLAVHLLDYDLYAVLALVGFVVAVVAAWFERSIVAAACVVVFFALTWNAIAIAGW